VTEYGLLETRLMKCDRW